MKNKSPDISKLEKSLDRVTTLKAEQDEQLLIIEHEGAASQFIIFTSDQGISTELRFEGEEPWFSQADLSQIFGVDVRTVSEHIKNFLAAGEIDESVIRKFRITASDGKSYNVNHYSLDVAFYVGYRVNSAQGALFRRWATKILIQVATKNYYIDKQKLKEPDQPSIINELRDELREIRAATANVYREVRRICSLCQDYDPKSKDSHYFYATMENKLLWAATSHTAAELIFARADAEISEMGLTSFSGKRGPTQKDVTIGNNYLAEKEAQIKNRATVMLLDYFEDQLDQGRLTTMAEIETKLDKFIKFNNWPLLTDLGRAKKSTADKHALKQLKIYKKQIE